jgi:membrane protein implicated in regulation of membrane protease activity
VCERQRALFRNEIQLPRSLEGLNLSVVLTNYTSNSSQPFFTLTDGIIDPDSTYTFAVLMDEVARRAGFFWRNSFGVVLPIDEEVDGNKTWSDLLEWEVNVYDISAGKWDRNPDRMKREISFPEGWFEASTIIVEATDPTATSQTLNFWGFLLPFQWQVWLLIIVTAIATGLMYFLLERMNAESDERHLEHEPGAAVFYSFITLTGHYEFRPRTTAARLLSFSLTFFALIIVAAYTANLVSFLVVRNTETFKVENVGEAVLMGAPICVQDAVAIDEYLQKKYPTAKLVRYPDTKEMMYGLKNKECVIAAIELANYDVLATNAEVNSDCTLKWQGRVEQIVPSGIATTVDTGILCSSLINYVLDYHLTEMRADGFIDQMWEDHLARVATHVRRHHKMNDFCRHWMSTLTILFACSLVLPLRQFRKATIQQTPPRTA